MHKNKPRKRTSTLKTTGLDGVGGGDGGKGTCNDGQESNENGSLVHGEESIDVDVVGGETKTNKRVGRTVAGIV